MVTRRARRWIRRGVAAAIIAVVAVLAAATWYTSEAIEEELLLPQAAEPQRTPLDVGIPFRFVDVPGPLGNHPGWQTAGADDTWVVFIPDASGSRDRALDMLPTVVDSGFPAVAVAMRGGFGAPPAPAGHHLLGDEEWEDVEAAVAHALGGGARDVVLVGYGTGGSAVLAFLRRSDLADRAVGAILDSPYLDPGAIVDRFTAEDNVPGFLSGWGRALATFRWGVDWSALDQVSGAAEVDTEILLFQGTADDRTPPEAADAFAEALPGRVRYVSIEGAGHLGGYADDPREYANRVGHFLRRVAVGRSDLPGEDGGEAEPE